MPDALDRLPDGVIVVGADRAITAINAVAERMTGWARAEAIGRFYGEVLRLRDASGELVHEVADPFTTAPRVATGSPERTYRLYRRDQSERWVALRTSYRRGSDGAILEVVTTLRDVARRLGTERSAYELIATLAHDLRSPLTSVKGFTSTILRNWGKFSDEQKIHMLETIEWDADRMNRLLTDLLNLARLEAGLLELKREEIDVARIAGRVGHRIGMDAHNHKIEVEFPEPWPPVMADPAKIEQVLVNLVENAVKHGDPGVVRVTGEVRRDDVVVRVSDVGPGIDARHLPYVFAKFFRGRSSTREGHASTGLGLYICKGVVETHGGNIRVERSDRSGTVFAFTLPRGEA